jgi:hypothetical protein
MKTLVWLMDRGNNHTSDKLIVALIWLMAVAFAFLVFEKFRLLFHK